MALQNQSRDVALALCFSVVLLLLAYIAIRRPGTILTAEFWFESQTNTTLRPVERPVISSNADDLEIALAKASMPNKTLIITAVNRAWMEPNGLLDLFLQSFRVGEETQSLLDYLLIVAWDEKAFNRCKQIHPHCYDLRTKGVDFSGEKTFMTKDYLKITQKKVEFLKNVVEHGFSFVFTDTDILWLRNPFRRFSSEADFQISCDTCNYGPSDLRNFPNTGFTFVRSNQQTIRLYNLWYDMTKRFPRKHDQDAFNQMKFSKEFSRIGVKLLFLDMAYFSGFCDTRATLKTVYTMHSNCRVGLNVKIHDLREAFADWMLFRLDVGRRSHMGWTFGHSRH